MEDFLYEKEIELIEKEIGRKCESIIFDSNKDNWTKSNSTFVEKMKNRSRFIILIQTTNGIQFGCYIEKMIKEIGTYITDPNAVVFKFRKNIFSIYPIKDSNNAILVNEKQGFWNDSLSCISKLASCIDFDSGNTNGI